MFKQFLFRFVTKECGAVTVDWVVLTALAVALVGTLFVTMEAGTLQATAAIFD